MTLTILYLIAVALIISMLVYFSNRNGKKYIYQCRSCHSILEYSELKYAARAGRSCPNCNSINRFDRIKK
jgi:hypothetical protein